MNNVYEQTISNNEDPFITSEFSEVKVNRFMEENPESGGVIYYPNGVVLLCRDINTVTFSGVLIGSRVYSGFLDKAVLIAEKSCDNKRIWLEWI